MKWWEKFLPTLFSTAPKKYRHLSYVLAAIAQSHAVPKHTETMLVTTKSDSALYCKIAEQTGVFSVEDLFVLAGVFEDYFHNPQTTYRMLEEYRNGALAGFVLFGHTPLTRSTWDLYWLIVDKKFQGSGIARILLGNLEKNIRVQNEVILRVETSNHAKYAPARSFYMNSGFTLAGIISHFYAPGEDLMIFSKIIKG